MIAAIAALVVGALNVNTLVIAERLYKDDALRAVVLAAAERTTSAPTYAQAKLDLEQLELPIGWKEPPREKTKAPAYKKAPGGSSETRASAQGATGELALVAVNELAASEGTRIVATTQSAASLPARMVDSERTSWIKTIAGLLITVFAATLGAPFWFDVLNKVMVIRATVKPREKSREEGSEDRR